MGRKRSRQPGSGALERKRQRWTQSHADAGPAASEGGASSSSAQPHDATAWQCVNALIQRL